jgi:hypothetical protein
MTDTTKKAMTLEQVKEIIDRMCESESVAPSPNPMCGAVCKLVDASDCYALRDWFDTNLSAQCEGDIVITKDDAGQIVAVTRQDEERRILSVVAENAPRAITLSEALNTLSDFAANGGTLHGDYAYQLHAAVDKIAQREGEAMTLELVQQLRGRAKYLRDIGRIKSPQLMERAADAIDAHLSAQRDVLVDFESLGTAGPFKIVEGRITLPIVTIKDIVQMYDAVPRESEAVGEYLANVDEYGGIRWIGAKPPHGTKLYTAPPPPSVEVTEKLVKAIADKVCRYNNSRYQPWSDSNSPHYGDAEYFVRRVLESANITLPTVSDEMIDAALTAYEEFTGQEADYEGIQKALEAVLSEKGHG